MCNSVAFSTFTILCNHYFFVVPKHLITPKGALCPLGSHSSIVSPHPLPQPLATTNSLSDSKDLPDDPILLAYTVLSGNIPFGFTLVLREMVSLYSHFQSTKIETELKRSELTFHWPFREALALCARNIIDHDKLHVCSEGRKLQVSICPFIHTSQSQNCAVELLRLNRMDDNVCSFIHST